MNRFLIAIALALTTIVAQAATCPKPPAPDIADASKPVTPLKPNSNQSETATLVANLMTRYHYDAVPLDDAMSKKIFKAYFDSLDGQKMFFTQADIDHFSVDRTKLDDAIWNGDLSVPFAIFNTYVKRLVARTAFAQKLLAEGFNFKTDETYHYDRKDGPWAKDDAALDKLWRERVKNDWLRLKLADKKDADIKKTLGKRYTMYLQRVRQLDSEDVFQSFMNSYAMAVDPHTNFFDPRTSENFNIAMKLSLEGIGAVLERRDEYTQIREIVPGGPASGSDKIHVGDRIVGVGEGKDCAMTDVVGWRLDDVVALIRGHKDTVVRLDILPVDAGPDGKRIEVSLVRKKVSIEKSAAKKSIIDVKRDGVTHKIGVIDLPSFYQDFGARRHGDPNYRSATRDVAKLLHELKKDKVDGVIVDLRNDGGGSLSEAASLTGLFIDKGPVVQVRNTRGKIEEDGDDDPGALWTGPLAVLVNRGSASASEIFTAAIQDYHRGLIIGSNTFGKGTVQNLLDLDDIAHNSKPSFGSLKMTIAQFFRIDGGSTQLRGVTPDIVFPTAINPDDLGESSYPNALPWSSIPPATYKAYHDISKSLVAKLRDRHKERIAKSTLWKVQLAEMDHTRDLRDRTSVSLNLAKRRAKRDADEALRKKLRAEADAASPAKASSVAVKPASASTVAGNKSASVAGSASTASNASVSVPSAAPDDGLQPGERSLKSELAKEKAAGKRKDVQLIEAAHVVSDLAHLANAKDEPSAKLVKAEDD